VGQQIHRLLREVTGNPDPYRLVKSQSNILALELYPVLKRRVLAAADQFAAAVRMAIAGNVIDFGCRASPTEADVRRAVEEAAALSEMHPDETSIDELRQAVGNARDILYLADNAGELVFDRLLIEQLPADCVTLVVRGKPVINDATRRDAEAVGLASFVPVIDNGSDVPGTILASCSAAFRARFEQCDLVIAKGQGNYETLSGTDANVFFLLKVKCPVIARHIGSEVGQMVVRQDSRQSEATLEEPAIRSEPAGLQADA
jgi:uncharacterized protein with ATP-grasp and redox domains